MRPFQHAFNSRTIQAPTGDEATGEAILSDLNVSLENLNQANDWLVRSHKLDVAVANEINAQGHVLGLGDTVSMEGVQVHLNSSQVDAIVEFLKKWVPIILKKIRGLIKQFLDWVASITAKIDGKVKNLRQRWTAQKGPLEYNYTVGASSNQSRAALSLIRKKNLTHYQPRAAAGYGQLIKKIGEAREHGMNSSEMTRLMDLYLISRESWIMMGVPTNVRPTTVAEMLVSTDNPMIALNSDEVLEKLDARDTSNLTISGKSEDLLKFLEGLSALQLKLNYEVRTHLSALETMVGKINDGWVTQQVGLGDNGAAKLVSMKSMVNLTTRCSLDLEVGLNYRLRIMHHVASIAGLALDRSAPAQ